MIYEYAGGPLQDGLYFLYAAWNSRCNVLAERITKIGLEFSNINIYRVNTTRFNNVKKQLEVNKIPSYLLIKDGKINSRKDGNVDYITLKKWLIERIQ